MRSNRPRRRPCPCPRNRKKYNGIEDEYEEEYEDDLNASFCDRFNL
jgi:hypothetical protein